MSAFSKADRIFMRKALDLAANGRTSAAPNPCVGCVIVRDGAIIGCGWHHQAGQPHAEIMALRSIADGNAKGADCYVTLEPCAHYGRTPPCAKALVQAGVNRVIAAVSDPNPKVAGKGFAILKEGGIQTACGLLAAEAYDLNRDFFKAISTGLPYVRVKCALSLDAGAALADGSGRWITNPLSRSRVQELRLRSGAVITGSGTVLKDHPRLSVRLRELPAAWQQRYEDKTLPQPLKVVLDGRSRIKIQDFALFNEGSSLLVQHGAEDKLEDLNDKVRRLTLKGDGALDLEAVLRYLGKLEIRSVLVEAGPQLTSAFLKSGLADELWCMIAPKFLGAGALPAFNLPAIADLNAPGMNLKSVQALGSDILAVYGLSAAAAAYED